MNFFMPTRMLAGKGCVSEHVDDLAALGSRCLIVCSAHAAKASGALGDCLAALAGAHVEAVVWDKVVPNPPVASCIEAGRVGAAEHVDFVLGIGGGSALDAAKAVAVFAANPALDEAGFYSFAWEREPLAIALVGTTAGTGSEVTKVSVLTDAARRKHSIHDDRLYARLAFGDSRYVQTCSHTTVLSCGVDVLAHATESYFSHKADEVSRAFAVRAVRLATGPLAAAASGAKLGEEEFRALYEASILGGLAINTTGTCFPHNVGYYLTENYGVPHGFASAVFMPAMLELAREADPAYAQAFSDEVGIELATYAELVKNCLPAFDIALTAEQVEAALPRWEGNGSVLNTRAGVTTDTIRDILCTMFVGK